MFFREVCKIFKNTIFHRTPPVTASAPPMAASVFFLKSSYFATLLHDVLIIYLLETSLKSNSFVYKLSVNC